MKSTRTRAFPDLPAKPETAHDPALVRRILALAQKLEASRGHGFLRRGVGAKPSAEIRFQNAVVAQVLQVLAAIERERAERTHFRGSNLWRLLRYEVLKERGARCECCGATPANGKVMHVDHVKPASKYPELALDKANLQVLCEDCNLGKSNVDETDWRVDAIERALAEK